MELDSIRLIWIASSICLENQHVNITAGRCAPYVSFQYILSCRHGNTCPINSRDQARKHHTNFSKVARRTKTGLKFQMSSIKLKSSPEDRVVQDKQINFREQLPRLNRVYPSSRQRLVSDLAKRHRGLMSFFRPRKSKYRRRYGLLSIALIILNCL